MKAEETVHTQIHGPWSSQISCGIQALSQWMILWYGMNVQSATVPYMQMQFHFPVISIGNDQESPCGLLQYIDSVLVGYCTILCKLHQRFQYTKEFLQIIFITDFRYLSPDDIELIIKNRFNRCFRWNCLIKWFYLRKYTKKSIFSIRNISLARGLTSIF